MKAKALASAIILTSLLSGCATTDTPTPNKREVAAERLVQQRLEVASTLRYQKQIDPLAYRILRGGLPYCGDEITYATGLQIANRSSFPKELRKAAREEAGLSKTLEVLWTIPGAPGDKAGIQAGDKVIALNGKKLPHGEDGLEELDERLATAAEKKQGLTLTILRDDKTREFQLETQTICHYPVVAVLNPEPNAYADGSIIAIHSGLLHLLPEDRDIAVVMAHELAHNIKDHPTKGLLASIFGLMVSIALDDDTDTLGEAASAPFSPPLEAEADYVGMYILANAGFDIHGAENVWRKFAAEASGAKEKSMLDSHPPTPERYVALKKTAEEIEQKKARGEPLKPNE